MEQKLTFNTFECYDTINDLLYDIYHGDLDLTDIKPFIDYLKITLYPDNLLFEYLNIINSLNDLYINSTDFLNTTNIGYKNSNSKNLIYFDIGFGDYYAKLDRFNLPIIEIEKDDDIFEKLDFVNISCLGFGANGEAFEVVDSNGKTKVLKLTKDNSEAFNSCLVLESNNKHKNLVHIYNIFKISISGIQEKYCIIQDKVNTKNIDIKERYNNLNKEFIEFKNLQ